MHTHTHTITHTHTHTHTHTITHSETCKQTHTAYALWLQATVVPYVSLSLASSASPLNMSPFQFSSILPSLHRTAPSLSPRPFLDLLLKGPVLIQPFSFNLLCCVLIPLFSGYALRPLAPLLTDPLISLDLFSSVLISSSLPWSHLFFSSYSMLISSVSFVLLSSILLISLSFTPLLSSSTFISSSLVLCWFPNTLSRQFVTILANV